jgi:hypothetical protein
VRRVAEAAAAIRRDLAELEALVDREAGALEAAPAPRPPPERRA